MNELAVNKRKKKFCAQRAVKKVENFHLLLWTKKPFVSKAEGTSSHVDRPTDTITKIYKNNSFILNKKRNAYEVYL